MENLTFSLFMEILSQIWNFKIFTVDQNPMTLGNLMIGVFLLFAGYMGARRLSQQIASKVFNRFDLDKSVKASLQQVAFYIMLIIFTLAILQFLNIPITVFTVLGSTLAIGLGFGSQNIVNNFISGLIIMLERPIRVGDAIEVGGVFGTVEEIGTRSTKVKATDNTHVVVPNSSFLEQNVLNWTLSDDVIRSTILVGVAYGSDTAETKKLLEQACDENPKVLKSPKPTVIFAEFGDNALNFELYYYSKIQSFIQIKEVASDLRFKIDKLFADSQLVIAFPQRDVHLDTPKPLSVKIIS
ncbi:MAG: mechanosensitive ion channel [Bdellovibrionaceae bacterium]|mgnify:CR=1 FL=1|jgi:potassium-dependent mechanosensitive channel|nr:mechanosensitive ion channel [Pseudobdellovibrionaceae bacterium]